jgi:hypothetical protein
MMYELAETKRQASMDTRHGYVHEVKQSGGERKVRVVLGINPDGQPFLSPWVHSEEQRGGTQEQHLVEKGQNVIVTSHGGDFRNATFSHSSESKSFPQPSQAPNVNGYSMEHGKLRTSHHKPQSNGGGGGGGGGSGGDHYHTVEIMDQAPNNPQHQDQSGQPEQSGGGGGQQDQQGGQQQQAKAAMTHRISESGYLTGRVGNDDNASRYAAHAKGAKIRCKTNTIFVNDQGCYATKPIQLMPKDPIPNDNA